MITAAGIGWIMEGERSCISGMPADSVRTLISPGGRGRILLGRRRVPKEELLAEVRDRIAQEAPGLPTAMCGRGHPLEEVLDGASGPLAVCVEDPACLLGEERFIASLDDSIMVLCCQELCHQVPVVFRVRRDGTAM